MPREPIIFLDKTYKTQGEFEAFVKHLIYNDIGVCNDSTRIIPIIISPVLPIIVIIWLVDVI